ncbi:hypothetical protein [Roseovarius gaetbuli]|uniref:hypothetical protein n=1 Tax=Roseovarius gaetbuli TaxID=1356575 RepID=UPI000A26AAE1|nr:hypothetical protein [Roseovarius gaetbuli]
MRPLKADVATAVEKGHFPALLTLLCHAPKNRSGADMLGVSANIAGRDLLTGFAKIRLIK